MRKRLEDTIYIKSHTILTTSPYTTPVHYTMEYHLPNVLALIYEQMMNISLKERHHRMRSHCPIVDFTGITLMGANARKTG